MQIHISNLNNKTTTEDIQQLFSAYDAVSVGPIRAIRDLATMLPKTFAFVTIPDNAAGIQAIKSLTNTMLAGNNLVITEAK